MKSALRAVTLLLSACVLCACASIRQVELGSSGAAHLDAPLTTLATSVNPQFLPDNDTALGQADTDSAQRFVETFGANFSSDFRPRLEERGVSLQPPGPGVPLLRIRVAAWRKSCPDQSAQSACPIELRIEGALLDSYGDKVWSFSGWVQPNLMDPAGYNSYYKSLLDLMYKDRVIAVN